jgi:hypothetical protein
MNLPNHVSYGQRKGLQVTDRPLHRTPSSMAQQQIDRALALAARQKSFGRVIRMIEDAAQTQLPGQVHETILD